MLTIAWLRTRCAGPVRTSLRSVPPARGTALRRSPLALGVFAAACGLSLASPLVRGADVARAEAKPGSLLIIGGALQPTNREVWSRFIDLAGGKGSKIAVFPTASRDPVRTGERTLESLRGQGGEPFLVPVAMSGFELDYQSAVMDTRLARSVRECSGIFFVGGSQERITTALVGRDGARTPLLDAVWSVYKQGGVIAGTSAGAAVMSEVMFKRPPKIFDLLRKGHVDGDDIGPGLGFLAAPCLIDQHAIARGRFARSLVAMHSRSIKLGVGVDEDTALVVEGDGDLQVIGARGAILIDLNEAKHDPEVDGFNISNAKLTYLDRGDRFNLRTRDLTTPKSKGETAINPNSNDFRPEIEGKIIAPDILSNWAVVDLMSRLVRSKHTEAVGWARPQLLPARVAAPAPPPASIADTALPAPPIVEPPPVPAPPPPATAEASKPVGSEWEAFEFRFYRGPDTLGWRQPDEAEGRDDNYTVANIRLDVRPLKDTLARAEPDEGK